MTKTDDKNIVDKSDGTAAYGLFMEYVTHSPKTGKLIKHERFFLASRLVCLYSRTAGSKRANWKATQCSDSDAARQMLRDKIAQREATHNVALIGEPLLIELAVSDIDAIKKGEAPGARHSAVAFAEKRFGKIDDETFVAPGFDATAKAATVTFDDVEYEVDEDVAF